MQLARLRPRFTLRTLAIFVTFICAYFGAWEATKKYGAPVKPQFATFIGQDGRKHRFKVLIAHESSPAPFIVRCDEIPDAYNRPRSQYYLWLFGPTLKLPFNCEIE